MSKFFMISHSPSSINTVIPHYPLK